MRHLKRLAVLADDEMTPYPSKTLTALLRYRPEDIAVVVDSRNADRDLGDVIGAGHGIQVVRDVEAALAWDPDGLLLADEPVGAALQPYWREQILVAIGKGLDVINGMHYVLREDDALAALARQTGATLWDLRRSPSERYFTDFDAENRPIVGPRPHSPGSRTVLAVGTDCSSGKMTTMLEVARLARERGLDPGFVATGQVGIMISGQGVAVDAVMSDFLNAVVDDEVSKATWEHDLVLVEGQGALNHPRYSAVTLGLLHGARPDAMILCHELGRTATGLLDDCRLPSLARAVEINEQAVRWISDRPAPVVGVSVITGHVPDDEARAALARITAETGLPATDVLRYGPTPLLDAILALGSEKGEPCAASPAR